MKLKTASFHLVSLLTMSKEYTREEIEKKVSGTGLNMTKHDYDRVFAELVTYGFLDQTTNNTYIKIKQNC